MAPPTPMAPPAWQASSAPHHVDSGSTHAHADNVPHHQQPHYDSSSHLPVAAPQPPPQPQQPQRRQTRSPPRCLSAVLLPPQQGPPRKTLVLDLDKTLIDCIAVHERPRALDHDFVYTDDQGTRAKVWTRPFLRQFLSVASQAYEVVLFTAAGQRHADSVLQRIDPQRTFFAHRLYGHHTSDTPLWSWVKDLSRLGRPLESTLLCDDSMLAGLLQPCNLVPVRPFAHDYPRRDVDTTLCDLLRFLMDKVAPASDVRTAIALHWDKVDRRPRRRPLHTPQPPPPALLPSTLSPGHPNQPHATSPDHTPRRHACACECHHQHGLRHHRQPSPQPTSNSTLDALVPGSTTQSPPAPTWFQCQATNAGCGCRYNGAHDMGALVAAYQSQQQAALWCWRADADDVQSDDSAPSTPNTATTTIMPSCGCCSATGCNNNSNSAAVGPGGAGDVPIMTAALVQAPLGLRRSPKRFLDLDSGVAPGAPPPPLHQQQQQQSLYGATAAAGPPPPSSPPPQQHQGLASRPMSSVWMASSGSSGSAFAATPAFVPPPPPAPSAAAVAAGWAQQQQQRSHIAGPFSQAAAAAGAAGGSVWPAAPSQAGTDGAAASAWAVAITQATSRLRQEASQAELQQREKQQESGTMLLEEEPSRSECRGFWYCDPPGTNAAASADREVDAAGVLQPSSRTSSDSSTTTMVDVSELALPASLAGAAAVPSAPLVRAAASVGGEGMRVDGGGGCGGKGEGEEGSDDDEAMTLADAAAHLSIPEGGGAHPQVVCGRPGQEVLPPQQRSARHSCVLLPQASTAQPPSCCGRATLPTTWAGGAAADAVPASQHAQHEELEGRVRAGRIRSGVVGSLRARSPVHT